MSLEHVLSNRRVSLSIPTLSSLNPAKPQFPPVPRKFYRKAPQYSSRKILPPATYKSQDLLTNIEVRLSALKQLNVTSNLSPRKQSKVTACFNSVHSSLNNLLELLNSPESPLHITESLESSDDEVTRVSVATSSINTSSIELLVLKRYFLNWLDCFVEIQNKNVYPNPTLKIIENFSPKINEINSIKNVNKMSKSCGNSLRNVQLLAEILTRNNLIVLQTLFYRWSRHLIEQKRSEMLRTSQSCRKLKFYSHSVSSLIDKQSNLIGQAWPQPGDQIGAVILSGQIQSELIEKVDHDVTNQFVSSSFWTFELYFDRLKWNRRFKQLERGVNHRFFRIYFHCWMSLYRQNQSFLINQKSLFYFKNLRKYLFSWFKALYAKKINSKFGSKFSDSICVQTDQTLPFVDDLVYSNDKLSGNTERVDNFKETDIQKPLDHNSSSKCLDFSRPTWKTFLNQVEEIIIKEDQ
ncbi:hypothetical protein RCL1_006678 [Eukaryota sp. TZLM3-RCL]